MVWVHFRKDRFPERCKSKLLPRVDGPYKLLAKINDKAYKIDLPTNVFGVSNTFNVADLAPYDGDNLRASRLTPFEGGGGEDDESIPTSLPSSIDDIAGRVDVQHKPNELRIGPITGACAMLLEQQVNSLLTEYNLFIDENFILPKSLHVCMISFVAEAFMTRGGEKLHEDNRKMVPIISAFTREERKAGAPPLKKKS
jgi:hypothetical protein